jgi:glycosyltransferase involved in cell wall biosynthesis
MKVGLATVQVPFISGGAEVLARLLRENLIRRGHEAEILSVPFKWYPAQTLLEAMVVGRLIDLTEVNGESIDVLIGLKFPAYFTKHNRKVGWLLHQHRQAYDLWGTEFGDIHHWPNGELVRETITQNDTQFLAEARGLFTISHNVSERLRRYNGLYSKPLYHPPESYEQLHCQGYEPFVFYPSRITSMKRQQLLVQAAAHLKSDMRIIIAGTGPRHEVAALEDLIATMGLKDRVTLTGFLTHEEKISYYARSSAVFFGGYDEDYGYVVLEGMFSHKAVITLTDAGGALEFVTDAVNGYVVPPEPRALAQRIDHLRLTAGLAKSMGGAGRQTISDMKISWDTVIDELLASAYS